MASAMPRDNTQEGNSVLPVQGNSVLPVPQSTSCEVRQLSPEELNKLSSDKNLVSDFKQRKYEQEARKFWDLFYKRNTTRFFKDRHWTTREFSDLCESKNEGTSLQLLEVGCGVGNFLFPILEEQSNIFIYACDFSPRAVQFVKENSLYSEDRCHAFQCDIVNDNLLDHIKPASLDVVTMIFVLSAIHPDKMAKALSNVRQVLKVGGCVLLRDYGLYDHAQIRFGRGHKLQDNFYVRQDGTRAYFFSLEKLQALFDITGFSSKNQEYIYRQTVNKKENVNVPRIFVQGKFVKTESETQEFDSLGAQEKDLQEGLCCELQSKIDLKTDTETKNTFTDNNKAEPDTGS